MKSILAISSLAIWTALSSCNSTGATAPAFQAGTQTVGVSFQLAQDDLTDSFDYLEIESVKLSGNWGFFVSPSIELGGALGYNSEQQTLNGTSIIDSDLRTLGLNGRFYLVSEGQVRPYVGAGFGTLSGSSVGVVGPTARQAFSQSA